MLLNFSLRASKGGSPWSDCPFTPSDFSICPYFMQFSANFSSNLLHLCLLQQIDWYHRLISLAVLLLIASDRMAPSFKCFLSNLHLSLKMYALSAAISAIWRIKFAIPHHVLKLSDKSNKNNSENV